MMLYQFFDQVQCEGPLCTDEKALTSEWPAVEWTIITGATYSKNTEEKSSTPYTVPQAQINGMKVADLKDA